MILDFFLKQVYGKRKLWYYLSNLLTLTVAGETTLFRRAKKAPGSPPVKRMKREKSTSTVGHYVKNSDLLPAVLEAKALGKVTVKLISMIRQIAEKYSSKHNFAGYSYREDMVAVAVTNLCNNALKFNPERSSNPFSFYTSAIHNSFLQYMAEEKKQRDIRDALLMDAGANPSYNFLEREKDEKDFELANSDYVQYNETDSDGLVTGDLDKEIVVPKDDIDRTPLSIRQRIREPSAVIEYTPDQYRFDPETGELTILVDRSAELVTPSQKIEAEKDKRRARKVAAERVEVVKPNKPAKKAAKKAIKKTEKPVAKKVAKKATKKAVKK